MGFRLFRRICCEPNTAMNKINEELTLLHIAVYPSSAQRNLPIDRGGSRLARGTTCQCASATNGVWRRGFCAQHLACWPQLQEGGCMRAARTSTASFKTCIGSPRWYWFHTYFFDTSWHVTSMVSRPDVQLRKILGIPRTGANSEILNQSSRTVQVLMSTARGRPWRNKVCASKKTPNLN